MSITLSNIVNNYGSPVYIYDLDKLTESYEKLKGSLPERSLIYYSIKANPNPEVTNHLIKLGCHAEVSSIGELNVVLQTGLHPSKCLYTGPGKTLKELEFAFTNMVNNFSIESWDELFLLSELSKKYKSFINITLRINPNTGIGKAGLKMTGTSSQFGIEEDGILGIPEIITQNKFLTINGIHIYNGSNFIDLTVLKENFKNALEVVVKIQNRLSIELDFIDLGGGFAAPFGVEGELVDYTPLKPYLEGLIKDYFQNKKRPLFAFESGRYLTSTCGILVGKVQSIKKSKDKTYCILDFGINHLGGMSGLRRIPTVDLKLLINEKEFTASSEKNEFSQVNLVGPLCTPLDYLAKNVNVPNININDIVYVPNVGAYGLTASLIGFLSRSIPMEVIVRGKEVVKVSRLKLVRE